MHWVDPTTLELFDLVVERLQRLPALLVVTFRPEFRPPWTGHAHVTPLTLNRLSRRHAAAMVEQVTGGKALPAEVLDQIIAKTDGVPLFVEELTKTVLESGLLRDAGRPLRAGRPAARAGDPGDAAGFADGAARPLGAGQGGGADRRLHRPGVLVRAARGGRGAAARRGCGRRWPSWSTAGLVFRRGAPPDASYTFKHALVQDAAYRSLLRSRRQQLHARIARAIEERFPEVVSAQPELVAHHLTHAGLVEQAIAYWQKAGELASARSALAEAVAHLTQALDLLVKLPDTRRPPAARARAAGCARCGRSQERRAMHRVKRDEPGSEPASSVRCWGSLPSSSACSAGNARFIGERRVQSLA